MAILTVKMVVDKYLEICHLGEGESTLLLRTNWQMSLTLLPQKIILICGQYAKSSTGRKG